MLNQRSFLVTLFLLFFSMHFAFSQNALEQSVTLTKSKSITLRATAANAAAFQWYKNGGAIGGATGATYVVTEAGTYQVSSYNLGSCNSELSDPVKVVVEDISAEQPADVEILVSVETTGTLFSAPLKYTLTVKNLGPGTASDIKVENKLSGQLQFTQLLDLLTGAAYDAKDKTLKWNIVKLESGQSAAVSFLALPKEHGVITNTAKVDMATKDPNKANNSMTNLYTISDLKFPTAFTPNGDGVNDRFVIGGLEKYEGNELTIMNRWGATIFKKKNYTNDWDGNGLSEGTYFYVLTVQTSKTNNLVYKGYTTLLRTKL